PIPSPNGSESEGPAEIAMAPPGFPAGLNNGVLVGFHGKGGLGGIANEENPLVFANLATRGYFHFISNDEPNIGHLDGLLSTSDSLFVTDLDPTGSLSGTAASGVIYQIQSIAPAVPDIRMKTFTANGQATVSITYEITGVVAAPFEVRICRSQDTSFGND